MTATAVRARGTDHSNERGSSADRRRRKAWLIATYRADVDVVVVIGEEIVAQPACRCYRCGVLLTEETVTVDRVVPGCEGGRYERTNLRPACAPCNSKTGARLGHARKAALKEVRS